jgi:hypothetical protein
MFIFFENISQFIKLVSGKHAFGKKAVVLGSIELSQEIEILLSRVPVSVGRRIECRPAKKSCDKVGKWQQ